MKNNYFLQIATILIFIGRASFGQSEEGSRVILSNNGLKNTSFYIYQPVFAAKSIYKKMEEAKNQYPEQLMSSILSVTTQSWEDFNTLGGSKDAEQKEPAFFESIQKMNKDKNYFELRCKLEYESNGEQFAIIKFYLIREGTMPMCGAYAMQKIAGRWFKTSTPLTSSLAFLLMSFDENKLDLVFQQKTTESPMITNLLNKIVENKQVSLSKLIEISNDWTTNEDATNTDFFLDKNSWINKK